MTNKDENNMIYDSDVDSFLFSGIVNVQTILQYLVKLIFEVAQWLERRSSAGELSLSCARPAANG